MPLTVRRLNTKALVLPALRPDVAQEISDLLERDLLQGQLWLNLACEDHDTKEKPILLRAVRCLKVSSDLLDQEIVAEGAQPPDQIGNTLNLCGVGRLPVVLQSAAFLVPQKRTW